MIELNKCEKSIILLCKNQLSNKYPQAGTWTETLKPLFLEFYGWDPDGEGNRDSYLDCIFRKLLDIHMKVKDRWSDENGQLKEIFDASFKKNIDCTEETAIERAIHRLCSIIGFTSVVDNDGSARFDLIDDMGVVKVNGNKCFSADHMVSTERGLIRASELKTGDVLTRILTRSEVVSSVVNNNK